MPLDHAIVLMKHLAQQKSANLELENKIVEMKTKMSEGGMP